MNDFFPKSLIILVTFLSVVGLVSILSYFVEISDQKAIDKFIQNRKIEKIESEIENIKSQIPDYRPPNTTPGGWSSQ